jgi:hypothetical protein
MTRKALARRASADLSLPKAALVRRTPVRSGAVLTFRVKHGYYRVEVHNTAGASYATIMPQSKAAVKPSSPTFTSVALAIAQALKSLAQTGGGAVGRLATQFPALTLSLLLALAMLCLGCALRTFAFATR